MNICVQNEIWKWVGDTPWKASSLGRIHLQTIKYARMPNGGFRVYTNKPMFGVVRRAAKTASHRYLGYHHKDFGNVKVHRLVCEAFHGPPPFEGAVVMHLNENPLDNRPQNLAWGTQKQNMNSPKYIAYCRSRVGENSPTYKARKNEANHHQYVSRVQ